MTHKMTLDFFVGEGGMFLVLVLLSANVKRLIVQYDLGYLYIVYLFVFYKTDCDYFSFIIVLAKQSIRN